MRAVYQDGIGHTGPLRCADHMLQRQQRELRAENRGEREGSRTEIQTERGERVEGEKERDRKMSKSK